MRKKTNASGGGGYHHGDLRNALIAVGTQVLEEIGPKELSLRHLARMVGVSEAAPSRHFSGKEELLAAIAAEGFRTLAKTRRAIAAEGGDPQWTVFRMMDSYVRYAQTHPGLFALMVGPRIPSVTDYAELVQAVDESFGLFEAAVRGYARSQGWPDERLDHVTHAAWAAEHGLATLLLGRRAPRATSRITVDEMIAFGCSIVLAGIAAGPEATARIAALGAEPA